MSDRPTKRRGPITILRESGTARRLLIVGTAIGALYCLSFGPACWLVRGHVSEKQAAFGPWPDTVVTHEYVSAQHVAKTYLPIIRIARAGAAPLAKSVFWYVDRFGGKEGLIKLIHVHEEQCTIQDVVEFARTHPLQPPVVIRDSSGPMQLSDPFGILQVKGQPGEPADERARNPDATP